MNRILNSRRTVIALTAIGCLTVLGLAKEMDVAASIASVAIAVAGSNAFQNALRKRKEGADVDI